MTSTHPVVAFLEARIEEDEVIVATARNAMPATYQLRSTSAVAARSLTDHAVRFNPARMLREIWAKRGLIKRYNNAVGVNPSIASFIRGQDDGYRQACLDAIRDAAQVYSGHPDYRPEWRLDADHQDPSE